MTNDQYISAMLNLKNGLFTNYLKMYMLTEDFGDKKLALLAFIQLCMMAEML